MFFPNVKRMVTIANSNSMFEGTVNRGNDMYKPWIAIFILILVYGCKSRESKLQEQDTQSLAEAYREQFKIGVALNRDQVEGKISKATPLVTKHFNSITPENLLKWERVHPQPNRYNFDPPDN